jgi:phosphatidylserine/phosphatidylglycerophosphate/cardiolipin synthase-like enzyme
MKIFTIDDEVYVGSMNIGDDYISEQLGGKMRFFDSCAKVSNPYLAYNSVELIKKICNT